MLSLFYKLSEDVEMKKFLFYTFKLVSLPGASVRLGLCAAVVHLLYRDCVKKIGKNKITSPY